MARKIQFHGNADFWQFIATDPPDSTTLESALAAYYDKNLTPVPFYPVSLNGKNPTWAKLGAGGALIKSDSVVGFNNPSSSMQGVLFPRDFAAMNLRDDYNNRYAHPLTPFPGINGTVQFACLFIAASDMDTTLIFHGEFDDTPIPAQEFWNILYANELPDSSPGDREYTQSVRRYMHDATNGHVDFRPDTTRWEDYDLPGILNPID